MEVAATINKQLHQLKQTTHTQVVTNQVENYQINIVNKLIKTRM
jgi:hypothetical protein